MLCTSWNSVSVVLCALLRSSYEPSLHLGFVSLVGHMLSDSIHLSGSWVLSTKWVTRFTYKYNIYIDVNIFWVWSHFHCKQNRMCTIIPTVYANTYSLIYVYILNEYVYVHVFLYAITYINMYWHIGIIVHTRFCFTMKMAPHPDWNFPLIFYGGISMENSIMNSIHSTGKSSIPHTGTVFQSVEWKKPLFSILSTGKSSIPQTGTVFQSGECKTTVWLMEKCFQ